MCHARHGRHARHAHRGRHAEREPARFAAFAGEPARGGSPAGPLRAGDADRERAAEALRTHAGEGRLDADELERRLEAVLGATYLSELDEALADLPRLRRARDRARPGDRGDGVGGRSAPSRLVLLLAAVAVLVVVTAITGLGALWWLMLPIAMLTHPGGGCARRSRPVSSRPVAG